MKTVHSQDGTAIAYDKLGNGPVVILVDGALGYRADPRNQQLANLLAEHFTVFNYDRRGRGDSSDTQPYAVEREIEDVDTLINQAGGRAYVFGMSSGAILALRAANALGDKVVKLALYEPPFILDDSRPPLPEDYIQQLQDATAAGERSRAVEIFMTQAILIPAEYLAPMKADPMWQGMEKVAHTLAYDGNVVWEFMRGRVWVDGTWSDVTANTLVITGENSEPFFHSAAHTLVDELTQGAHHALSGQDHNVDMAELAPVLIDFFWA